MCRRRAGSGARPGERCERCAWVARVAVAGEPQAGEGAQELPPAVIGLEQMLERVGVEPLLAHRIAADA